MKLSFFGIPGAGKGTQVKMVSKEYKMPAFSTGDAFRESNDDKIKEYLLKGELVPDMIVFTLVKRFIDGKRSFILDGYPRNLNQAELLDNFLHSKKEELDYVINIVVDEEEIIDRLTNRYICPNCNIIYNIKTNPPEAFGKCDICNGELMRREDDNEETIRNRIRVFRKEMEPVIDYYNDRSLLVNIDGNAKPEEVFKRIKILLNGK